MTTRKPLLALLFYVLGTAVVGQDVLPQGGTRVANDPGDRVLVAAHGARLGSHLGLDIFVELLQRDDAVAVEVVIQKAVGRLIAGSVPLGLRDNAVAVAIGALDFARGLFAVGGDDRRSVFWFYAWIAAEWCDTPCRNGEGGWGRAFRIPLFAATRASNGKNTDREK